MAATAPGSAEEMLALLEAYEQSGRSLDDVPQELADLLRNLKKGQGQPTPDVDTEEITPEPGFVVKTVDETGRKVFINMCGSTKVPAPGNWSGGIVPDTVAQALENLDSLDDQQMDTLRFPLSMGPPKPDLDAKGDPCSTFDCVLALDVVRAAAASRRLKAFLIELALNWVSSKHKMQLDPKFKLPKMRYKGEVVASQRIRMDRKPLVTEIRDVEEEPAFPLVTKRPPPGKIAAAVPAPVAAQPLASTAQQQTRGLPSGSKQAPTTKGAGGDGPSPAAAPVPSTSGGTAQQPSGSQLQELTCSVEYEGRPVEAVHLLVLLPAGKSFSSEALQVEVAGQDVRVAAPACRTLNVHLPLAVSANGADATVADGSLRLRLPYKSLATVLEEAKQAAPLPLGALKLSNQSYLELEP